MPKLPWKVTPARANVAWRFWREIRSLAVGQIAQEAERPFSLALVGGEDQTKLLAARLALETPTPRDGPQGPANVWPYLTVYTDAGRVPKDSLRLDADALTADETRLAQALAQMVVANPDLRLSLACHIPAFRPAVVLQLINEVSWTNAKIATVSALPGLLPFTGFLLPATSMSDMIVLTKNQGLMLLRIAAAYGLPVDLRARTRELLPVVGSAFGWRSLARELLGFVPGGFGIVLKGSIAFAGTYTVGKAAQIFYSTGQTLTGPRLQQLGRDAAKEARTRISEWLRRRKGGRFRRGGAVVPPDLLAPDALFADPTAAHHSEAVDKPVQIRV